MIKGGFIKKLMFMLNCEVLFVTIFLWTALMNIWYRFCEKQTSLCFRCDDIYDNETLSLPWYFQYFYHDKHQISLFQMWWYPTSPCMKVMVMTMVIYTMMTVCTMISGTGGDPSHLFLALDFSPAGWPRSWNTWLRYTSFQESLIVEKKNVQNNKDCGCKNVNKTKVKSVQLG